MELNRLIDSTAVFVALAGFASSMVLQQCNQRAALAQEDRRLETMLITQAIEDDDKALTMKRLKLLIQSGLISQDRAVIVKNLSDSTYAVGESSLYTGSDAVACYALHVMNNEPDVAFAEQEIRGAHVRIESTDTTTMPAFHLASYTDNMGWAEVVFPEGFLGTFVRVTIEKEGYRTKVYETALPAEMGIVRHPVSLTRM